MDYSKLEIAHIEEVVSETSDAQFRELSDFQLAFVGGGMADTVGH